MTKASDNEFPKLILKPLGLASAPADASWKLYPMADGVYARSSNSIVGPLGAGGGGGAVATDAIWDAKGDLVGGTGANTAARLAVGTDAQVLTADSTQATGMKWAAASAGALALLEQHTAAASATLDFTTFISATYDEYLIEVLQVIPATTNQPFNLQMGTGAGPTWDTAANYRYAMNENGVGGSFNVSANAAAAIRVLHDVNNTANYSGSTKIRLFAPASAIYKTLNFEGSAFASDSNWYWQGGAGMYQSTTAITGLRFLFAAGNITSGTIRVYGIAK